MRPIGETRTMDELLRMLELTGQGFHCSQILLFLGFERGKSNPDLIRAMSGLAGGVGFCGDTCGAVDRRRMFDSADAGRGAPEEEDHPRLNLMINELVEWFTLEFSECYGGIHCREILDRRPGEPVGSLSDIVTRTYQKVKSLLLENGFDLAQSR